MTRIDLLLAWPCDPGSFERAVRHPGREWLAGFSRDPDRAWHARYAVEVAQPLAALLRLARSLDVTVVEEATLDDLAWSTLRADAVLVMAHWKDHAVRSADIAGATAALLARRLSASPEHAGLARCVGRAKGARQLTRELNRHIDEGGVPSALRGEFCLRAQPATLRALRRGALDDLLAGLLRPGNCLELCDGLHDVHAVEQAIAPGFEGVLDLTACRAGYLADHIDRMRCGTCGVLQFRDDVLCDVAALSFEHTLRLWHALPDADYRTVRVQALRQTYGVLRREVDASHPLARWWRAFRRGLRALRTSAAWR